MLCSFALQWYAKCRIHFCPLNLGLKFWKNELKIIAYGYNFNFASRNYLLKKLKYLLLRCIALEHGIKLVCLAFWHHSMLNMALWHYHDYAHWWWSYFHVHCSLCYLGLPLLFFPWFDIFSCSHVLVAWL